MTEADLAATLKELGGRAYTRELAAWVHGTRELPLQALLEGAGVQVHEDTAALQQSLGLRTSDNGGLLQVKTVLRGGAAENAGMSAGDEWLGVEVQGQGWRISKLDDVTFYAGTHTTLQALVARDGRLLRLSLEMPPLQAAGTPAKGRRNATATAMAPDTISLTVTDAAAVGRWLA